MTVVDLHPDELFDREAEGLLSPEERVRLDQHLAQCSVCRLERQLSADFEAELGPYAESANLQSFVSGALLAAAASPEVRQPQALPASGAPAPVKARPLTRRVVMLMAATLLFVSGLAAAQPGVAMRVVAIARESLGLASSAPSTKTPLVTKARRRSQVATRSREVVAAPAPLAIAPSVVAVPSEAAPAETAAPVAAVASSRRPMPRAHAPAPRTSRPPVARGVSVDTAVREPAPAIQSVAQPAALDTTHAQVSPPNDAQSLFEQANAARRQGRMGDAASLYRELRTKYPNSSEARVSLMVMGRLRLDRGDARGAIESFEAYLATSDLALREEAMVGRAMAHQRLGREGDERESVRALLRAYPRSPYGLRAQKRLGQGEP